MQPSLQLLRSHRRRIANLRRELRVRLRQLRRCQTSLFLEKRANAMLRQDLRLMDELIKAKALAALQQDGKGPEGDGSVFQFERPNDGAWVKYTDHAAEVARLAAQVQRAVDEASRQADRALAAEAEAAVLREALEGLVRHATPVAETCGNTTPEEVQFLAALGLASFALARASSLRAFCKQLEVSRDR